MELVEKRYNAPGTSYLYFPRISWLQLFASFMEKLRETVGAGKEQKKVAAGGAGPANISILLADDDNDDREFFTEIVSEVDPVIRVNCVEDGRTLMEMLTADNALLPDILFLDLNMPGMDGKQCLKEIKSHSKLSRIPVVIYSTSALLQDIKDTHSNGANLYLRKPNNFNSAIALIKKVFEIDLELMATRHDIKNFVLS